MTFCSPNDCLLVARMNQPPDNTFLSDEAHPENTPHTNIPTSLGDDTVSAPSSPEMPILPHPQQPTSIPTEALSALPTTEISPINSAPSENDSFVKSDTVTPSIAAWDEISSQVISEEKNSEAEPFAHAKYGFAAVVSIYLMYQFAGGALHSLARNHSGAFEIVLQGLGQLFFMLAPALIVMRYSPLKMQGLMRSGGEVTAAQWALGLLGIFGIQIFDAGFIALQERLMPSFMMPIYQQLRAWSDMVEQFYRTSFAGTTAWEAARALIIGAVIPAFAEEILFRGVLQRSLEEVYPIRRAVIITAILFGILHFNPLSVIPLILIGAYLGFLAYYTQSLALPIVAHFLNNAIAIVALYAPSQGVEVSPYGISLGRGLLLAFVGIGVFVGAYWLIRRFTPQAQERFSV